MANGKFTHKDKQSGDLIQSADWNAGMNEILRLETAKINRQGADTLQGPLTIQEALIIGSGTSTSGDKLEVKGNIKAAGAIFTGSLTIQPTLTAGVANTTLSAVHIKPNFTPTNLPGVKQNGLVVEAGNVGIGTTSPDSKLTVNTNILHDNNFNYGDAQITIFDPNNNGGNSPSATRDILHLVREGVGNQAFGNKLSLALGRYENNGYNSRTQLDIKLTDGNFDSHNPVVSLRSNGNVGVGTTSPGTKLHVVGNNSTIDIETAEFIRLHRPAVSSVKSHNSAGLFLGAFETGIYGRTRLDFKLSGTPGDGNVWGSIPDITVMTLQGNGNVGVGTTSPDSKLTVNANILHDNNFNYGDAQITIFDPNNNGGTIPSATRDILHLVREGVANQTYGNKVSLALGRYENNGYNSRTQLDIKLTDGYFDSHNPVVSLRSNGNVGVGTTSPGTKLHVVGNNSTIDIETAEFIRLHRPAVSGVKNHNSAGLFLGAFETGIYGRTRLDFKLSGTPGDGNVWGSIPDITVMTLQGNGNVGVGTTSPDSKLTVNANILHDNNFNYGDAQITIFDPNNNGGTSPSATRDILHLVREGIANQAFGNKVSLALGRYENNGYNSRTQLDIKLTDGYFDSHNPVVSLRSNGNVGVGTTSPEAKLEVKGGETKLQQQGWITPIFKNGWVNYENTYNFAGYFKDSLGIVHLRGLVKAGTNAVIFTLPEGYRPASRELLAAVTADNAIGRLDILTNGEVTKISGSSVWFSLDGVTFRAA